MNSPICLPQFDVVATDLGSIPLTSLAPARVTVNVIRNRQAPVFVNTPYFTTINRTLGIGLSVYEVEAVDSDTDVSTNIRHRIHVLFNMNV